MSRLYRACHLKKRCFPRSRGDEPFFTGDSAFTSVFSPLTRG